MAELKDVFQGVLVKAHNWTEAEVSSLFNEDGSVKDEAQETILAKHSEQVSKLKDKNKSDREDQYKRGRRERGEELEKVLKAVGVELGDATGEDAVKKLTEHIESVSKPSDLDDDKVKNSPLFRKREKELLDQVKAKEEEHKKAWSERDAKEQRERTLSQVKGKAKAILDELKPVLSEDPKKAANQLKLLERDLEDHLYEADGEDYLIKDAKGERVENANGTPMSVADFVKSRAEQYYDFAVSEKKGSAGDVTKGTVKGAGKLAKPANRKEYADKLHEITSDPSLKPEEKAALAADLKELAKDLA